MSENSKNDSSKPQDTGKQANQRSTSPNPFLPFLSTSPKNISPRPDVNSASPRSPRDLNGSPRDMLTGGKCISNRVTKSYIFISASLVKVGFFIIIGFKIELKMKICRILNLILNQQIN